MSTSKIEDLPRENVTLEKREVEKDVQQRVDNSQEITNLVKDLNENKEVMGLPNRDIPRNPTSITNDASTQPNYVPKQKEEDYIKQYEDFIQTTTSQTKKEKEDQYNAWFEEFKLPILATCLFFLFQTPIIRKTIYEKIPFLFSSDGNPKLHYFVAISLVFGSAFYGSQKLL